MGMTFNRKLPIPKEIKELYPLTERISEIKKTKDKEIADIFEGKDNRLLLIIGPCSADNEESVMDYIGRLARVQEQVKDKVFIIPRIYTGKPRTTGAGYKGMLHQPDPNKKEDMLQGIYIKFWDIRTGKHIPSDFDDADISLRSISEKGCIVDIHYIKEMEPSGGGYIVHTSREIRAYVPFAAMEDGLQESDLLVISDEKKES